MSARPVDSAVAADLPADIAALVRTVVAMPGVVGVALGGSRATDAAHAASDWDFAVYYRGSLDCQALSAYGDVFPPGSWGRLMNGGGWFRIGAASVDVLFRDLDTVLHWSAQAAEGAFELDALLGYCAGIPTYSLAAELALGRTIAGALPPGAPMSPALRELAPPRWRFARDFSLEYARMHAERGNAVGVAGQVAKAAMEEAHARLCERGVWSLNEKRLLDDAGLTMIQPLFREGSGDDLAGWITRVSAVLQESTRP